ncbi:MAG: hypothetical protein JF588_02855 [Caulobacterales bacterium]|nr:hypothetical protein [Caulobacterales bacterium]
MRRVLALAAAVTLIAGAAQAETWVKYADGDNGTQWSFDKDYVYKDQATGRLVVMKAISKPSVNIAPGGPDKGVGFVEALDCKHSDTLKMGAYKPSTGLAMDDAWRKGKPIASDKDLVKAACPLLASAPVK